MLPAERPFLTARWTDLLLLNFAAPVDVVAELAPPGTEPDSMGGQTYLSVVGFQFRDTRVFGCPWPRHTNFPEVNLRFYVRRKVGGEFRRGVVFVREIVPRHAIALIANRLYHENYVCRPMRSESGAGSASYAWRSGNGEGRRWNTLSARTAGSFQLPAANSLEEFVVEHYWGYARGRDGVTREYRVAHEPWRVAPAVDVTWDCDVIANYPTLLAPYLVFPVNCLLADGAAVEVFPGQRVE